MGLFTNIDLLTVGISVSLSSLIGFIVFFREPRNLTNISFLSFTIINAGWSIFNYISYTIISPEVRLWIIRFILFSAVLHSFSFFTLIYTFPRHITKFSWWWKYLVAPFVILLALFTLSPFVFSGIQPAISAQDVPRPIPAPGILLFAISVVAFIIAGITLLIIRIKKTRQIDRRPFDYLLWGIILMFVPIIFFNLVLPIFFGNTRFIPLSATFTLPFIILTAYGMIKYNLFNIKVVSAEIITVFVSITTFIEILVAHSSTEIALRSGVFGIILIFGILLIRSVHKEIEQREQVQHLAFELAAANEKLKQLDQAKSEFISIASHQIRTPLTVIKGYISLALEGTLGPLTAQAKESLGKAAFSTEQLVKLINELLDLSRIESGKITYVFAVNDLIKIIDDAIGELTPQANAKHITVKKEIKPGIEQFIFDRDKIREIAINLLHNALKYTAKGQVVIRAEIINKSPRSMVRLSVKDSGMGIAKKDIQKIFTKFGRTEDARLIDPSGMGLGLFFVKKVAEDHSGTAWAESEGLGKGSIFIVELPLKQ